MTNPRVGRWGKKLRLTAMGTAVLAAAFLVPAGLNASASAGRAPARC